MAGDDSLQRFLKATDRQADDVLEIVNLRIEVPTWNLYLDHFRVITSMLQWEHSHVVTLLDTISITGDSILVKGLVVVVDDYPDSDPVTQAYEAEFSFEKPIPSLEVPVVEDTAHPKGAQYGESQPQ